MKKLLLFLAFAGWMPTAAFAQIDLKQSTATTVDFYLEKLSDGTANTGITVTNITAKLTKKSDTLRSTVTSITCAASGSSNDCVEVAGGLYNMELSASDTDTLGELNICFIHSTSRQDCLRYMVRPSAYFDVAVTTGPATINCSGGVCESNIIKYNGTAVATPTTAGLPLVEVKRGTGIPRAQQFSWVAQFRDSSGSYVQTGTPTCRLGKDTRTLTLLANTPTAVDSNGYSLLTFSATETNATDFFVVKCTLTGAVDYNQEFKVNQAP